MRLTGFETLPNLTRALLVRTRTSTAPWLARGAAGLERLAPYRDRLGAEIRKHPRLAAGVTGVSTTWDRLVDAFCTLIDPYLSRYFPDMRLVAVTTASGDVELHRIGKGATTALGALAALDASTKADIAQTKWTAIELRLRPEQVLQRTLSLPAASRDFLGPIIEHRLERLTPWRPDRVLYGYRTLAEPEAGGGVSVALTATSKDVVAAPLQALAEVGLMPNALGANDEALTERLRVNLFRGQAKPVHGDSRRVVSRVALTAFAVFALAYVGSALWVASTSSHQDEEAGRLMKARRLLKAASLGAVGDRERALLEAKQPDKATVVLIDRLATAIPEDTFLKELAVTPDKVRLVGISGNAPALIGKLEATGLVNVRFTSAVTREKDQRDSFEISADRAIPPVVEAP